MPTIDEYIPARLYLAPKNPSLWRWDPAWAEAIVWANGDTIIFREELLPVLTRLSTRGLPPMNALVWLLAACRRSWPEASRDIIAKLSALVSLGRGQIPDWLPQLMTLLDAVHAMPDALRTPPATKAELAMMVFEGARPWMEPADAVRVVRVLLERHTPHIVDVLGGPPDDIREVLADLRVLHEGLKKFDAETFYLRCRTGLEHSIEPAEIDLEPAEQARQLIARLQEDEELGGLARIARCLLAAIQLPRAISDEEDVPVGGVSDISNHGPLDRLMLSELANDGLTLAVRVAMNEALYLRRETPPGNPPRHRAVLLDSGVRLWGVPRVFATAVGMALAAGGHKNVRTDFFRASAGQIEPVALTHRDGLIAHLECLEAEAHPGASLEQFAAAAASAAGQLDAVIVTGEDVAADRDFQRALAATDMPTVLLATVSRTGRFRLVAHGKRGRKLLREAVLDLDSLLAPAGKPKQRQSETLIDRTVPDSLPAILSVQPFPLLLSSQPFIAAQAWPAPWDGVLSISNNRCLFHWRSRDRGARLLSDRVPSGAVLWTGAAADGSVSLAVVGALQQGNMHLLRVDSRAEQCETFRLDLREGRPVAVSGHAGAVLVIYTDRVDAFDATSGLRLQSTAMSDGMRWRRDRFFRNHRQWFAMSYDGLNLVFVPLLSRGIMQSQAQQFLTFVDVPSIQSPVGIMYNGAIHRAGSASATTVNHGISQPLRLERVSRSGETMLISDANGKNVREVSLADGKVRKAAINPHNWVDSASCDPRRFVQAKSVRIRFTSIFVDGQGQLGLIARRRTEAIITLMQDEHIVLVVRKAESPDKRAVASFSPVPGPPGVGYTLQMARWPDGSRAWLDSRGMLHLKSSNATVPEMTLILRDGWLAGWVSDGSTFGMDYFSDVPKSEMEHHVYYNVLQAFLAELP